MQILGIGIDIFENIRIKKLIKNNKFLLRIYSKDEIDKSKKITNKVAFFSKRYAAKEAFSKALGYGFRKKLNFKDVSVSNDKYGKPLIKMNSKIKNLSEKKFNTKKLNIFLSLSDEKKYSIAFVIIGKKWILIKVF